MHVASGIKMSCDKSRFSIFKNGLLLAEHLGASEIKSDILCALKIITKNL